MKNTATQTSLILVVYAQKPTIFTSNVAGLQTKFVIFSIFSKGYIFHYLQHLATKLCKFSNFKMLFLAVVKDFVHLAWFSL